MKAIGGYFELELPLGAATSPYHNQEGFIALNTGRGAFEYALKTRGYKKVLLPYYTCDVMLEPIEKLGLEVEFYHIDNHLDPLFDRTLESAEVFVYTNYYGLKSNTVKSVSSRFDRLIIDNSQSFFSKPIKGVDTIYSARKFIGVPDGGYLYTECPTRLELQTDVSHCRMSHLLKRLEVGAEFGYSDFCKNDSSLTGQGSKNMSSLTSMLLQRVSYGDIIRKRKENFVSLHRQLGKTNGFLFDITATDIPMVYPYICTTQSGVELRKKLLEAKIYIAKYWPNVEKWTSAIVENNLVNNLLALPIDQRVSKEDLNRIVEIIEQ